MISFPRTKIKQNRLTDLSRKALQEAEEVKEKARGLREFVESLREDANYEQPRS